MRFILNFFFFGFLFFLIAMFFPEAFATMVSWAQKVYTFLSDLIQNLNERLRGSSGTSPTEPTKTAAAFFALFCGTILKALQSNRI